MNHIIFDESDGKLVLLDQRYLPLEERYVECRTVEDVARAIENMVVRGAPAIGIAAAFGMALAALRCEDESKLVDQLERAASRLRRTRPTAINLFWAIDRILEVARRMPDPRAIVEEAKRILEEDIEINRRIGRNGAQLIQDGSTVLTHCNAGSLATGGYGTALGVIRAAVEEGKDIRVIATETRPFLQGARLTVWELARDGIDVTLVTDNMVGYLMRRGLVDAVVVGADRIARNGDTANKIGTYTIAVLAREHGIPFYVAAPLSTIDPSIESGDEIPIEERDPEEVRTIMGVRITLPDVKVLNPAFDVTPAKYITAIITEAGVLRPPYEESISRALESSMPRR